jgi:hypothetical protein
MNDEIKNTLSDNQSILSLKSTKSRRSNRSNSIRQNDAAVSEDLSLSQLELMANKKKLNKQNEELSLHLSSKKEGSSYKINSNKEERKHKSVSSSISSSSSSISTGDTKQKRRKEKAIIKENRNDEIRKEKSEFLFKFNKMNVKGKWSSLHLDMNSSLDDIKNEYERVRNEIQTERSVSFFKRMLLLGVQGIEMMNTKFDPLGVDLDGWSEAMGYSMENQEYDEVMAELYEKYKGRGQMSPEVKLIFMIISSATMFTITKKITKSDSNNALKNFIGGLMGGSKQQSQQAPQQYQQPQQAPQQYQQQPKYQYNIPNPSDLRNVRENTETSDGGPSRISGPNSNYISSDGIDIENILKTMNDRKKEKMEQTETSDDIMRNIPIGTKKNKRGRPPKKANQNVNLVL